MENEKKLFRAEITVMLYAEDETMAKNKLIDTVLIGRLYRSAKDANIHEVDLVPSEWYGKVPYGDDYLLTCGEILRQQREKENA